MTHSLRLSLLAALPLVACARSTPVPAPLPLSPPEDVRVYAAALDTVAGKPAVLLEGVGQPRSIELILGSLGDVPGLPGDAGWSFANQEPRGHRLPRHIPSRIPVRVIRESDLPEGHPRWGAFYSKFPGTSGLYIVTEVAYSADRDWAVVELAHYCNTRCAMGMLVVLRRTAGEWRPVFIRDTWIA